MGAVTDIYDPELVGDFHVTAELTKTAVYAIQFSMARRAQEPREDLTSLIRAGDFGGKAMSDLEFGSFFTQLVIAGNDTTKRGGCSSRNCWPASRNWNRPATRAGSVPI
ncbi:hypothetical protein [Nocardia seriolae]|uniref:Cytochrome P450 n=1 Tax=Nocardia seriolae TaxID=37332 RepID=A0ABC8B291_9NOCA|nr:hypothetical protein [Nocardia seriolae]APB00529.1 hypothetical protein NS506_06493 [Nocardia seriolae]OJF79188.1 hypothetical protein NS14008_08200 [Nocardia seriolae]QOW30516.1 hypothetical protein IMZ23_20055 [Nocardia seriolae]QUN15561.1 hypothetical protein KEC46_24845 [Nocardia seriolae]WNJ57427.1 hypothetical protein RMO66_28980 [Nocardia seriolae]